jgi:hypothetical protein
MFHFIPEMKRTPERLMKQAKGCSSAGKGLNVQDALTGQAIGL